MIIVDTNILVYLYIQGEYTASVELLLDVDSTWVAPLLWRSEFRNVLALYIRKKIISVDHAMNIMTQAEALMAENEYQPSSAMVLELVHQSQCSAYDCEFVSLAKQFEVPLITQDKKISAEFPRYTTTLKDFLRLKNQV
ncbi:MAG: type II toxin-antitoxin system VapC family toxin [Gammaproteobacteria bacterium]|nr:type II toxin-antitoxin system VapC family toxin [Gammaproteobacteria bacterium]